MVILKFDHMIVDSLYEYPVKGLQGSKVACATIGARGLNNDRRWMIVDSSNSFISQRQFPILTQFLPFFGDELLIQQVGTNKNVSIAIAEFRDREEVEVWGQVVSAHIGSKKVNEWLSTQIGQDVKLVYMNDSDIRPIASSKDNAIVSFADGYPVLLTGTASLADLNSRMESKIAIDRFRTNIHIRTNLPFEEENWQRIKIGEVLFNVAKKSARCHVINIDQHSGNSSKEPLKTLSTFRKEGNKVNFGMNLIPDNSGIIHQSDTLEVIL